MANYITYATKVGLVAKTTHINQWWDDDANEVKSKANLNDDRITALETCCETTMEARLLGNYLYGKKLFDYTIDMTPTSVHYGGIYNFGSGIAQDEKYIFTAFNDTTTADYLSHVVYRFNKATERIDTVTIATATGYSADYHKLPFMIVTKAGTLLIGIEQLPGSGNHNGPIEIFRWADTDDLTTYTSVVVGNATTERLAYPFFYESGTDVILEARRYSTTPQYRAFYSSSDDGVSFGAMADYITYGDSDYWIYTVQVTNNINELPILAITPQNDQSNANCYQYVTYLRTDFTNFYQLDGTDLGTSVTGAELEAAASWGDTTKNTNLYYITNAKIIGDEIYAVGYIGTRTSALTNVTSMQIFSTNINTGVVTTGATFATPFASTSISQVYIYQVGSDLFFKAAIGGDILHYKVGSGLSSVTLIATETGNYHADLLTNMRNGLNADFDTVTKSIRIYNNK